MWNTHRYSPAEFVAAVEVGDEVEDEDRVGNEVEDEVGDEVEDEDGRPLPPTTLRAVGKKPMPSLFLV